MFEIKFLIIIVREMSKIDFKVSASIIYSFAQVNIGFYHNS